jgi:uncharacterized tellurite resistance protein B-like protein
MSYQSTITRLFFILSSTDGSITRKELDMSYRMVEVERFDADQFQAEINLMKTADRSRLLTEAIHGLKQLSLKDQLRAIAWLCVLANADGFMDKSEWQFIYRLYNTELGLSLNEVMKVQKQLTHATRTTETVL